MTASAATAAREITLDKETPFIVYCLERYRYYHGLSGAEAANLFKDKGIFEYIRKFYDVLHTMSDQYIMDDIDEFAAQSG